jgi:tetratricopeptide (TPR) repeat protein
MRQFSMMMCLLGLVASQTGCQLGEKARSMANGLSTSTSQSVATENTIRGSAELSPVEAAQLALRMAEALEAKEQDADAAAHYEKARKLDPTLNDRAARRLAVLYDKLDNQAQALIEFQEQLKKNPKDADLLSDLGYSYYNRGQWPEAEKHLREALRHSANHKRASVNLGLALAQQGRQQEALEVWMTVITPAESYANLGFVCLTQGKTEEAKASYREALKREPQMTTAQQTLAKLEGKELEQSGSK